ncbi:CdaR family transcriptional regulator [Cytobacillus gottheilii]|uniref:CdaR family transcriptional regulator n=1 Tax=Cytobacillus gottheilii TaxID=859144 RepID=UPI0009B9D46D|nr:sugar diacid recognition domain-containing protein [Cytobacillus gottheilii]
MLSAHLAEKIISEVKKLLSEDIIIVSKTGTIIASTDKKRIGDYHEGALLAAAHGESRIITKEDEKALSGVKAGINLPVFLNQEVIGVIGITGSPSDVSPFGIIIQKMTELLIRENHYSELFEWQTRALEGFIFEWLQQRNIDASFLERARLLGINMNSKRQVILLQWPHSLEPLTRNQWQQMLEWPEKKQNDLLVRWGNERMILLLEVTSNVPTKDKIQNFIQFSNSIVPGLRAGVGRAVDGIYVTQSLQQAERALKSIDDHQILCFDEDLIIELILDELSADTKRDYLAKTLSPLQDEDDLMLTIKELFQQNQSLKKTAEALHIHINTLHYRINKIKTLTGLSLNNVYDVTALYLAFLLLDKSTKK